MGNPNGQRVQSSADFKRIYALSGFWSTYGYDGLSMVFDVPVESVRSLPEKQKQALMRLLADLAKGANEAIAQTQELASLSADERFIALVRLSARFVT